MDALGPRSRLALLLEAFGEVRDDRQSWRVAYPLREVLFLAVCATMADCDDYETIAAWGEAHLGFLRRFSPFHPGVPCGDWLAALMNRIDGDLFTACVSAWVEQAFPGRPELLAIDGESVSAQSRPRPGAPPPAPGVRLRHEEPAGAGPPLYIHVNPDSEPWDGEHTTRLQRTRPSPSIILTNICRVVN